MTELRISVAMCTYNGARFLSEQLDSIAAQTRPPDEIVVCDDGSSDESADVVKAFAHRAPFAVRLEVNAKNLGSTKNFEKAIGLCQGEIIALADQDDVWHPRKLERIADIFLRSQETVAVFSDAGMIDQESRSLEGRLWNSFFFFRKDQKRFVNGQALNVLLKHPVVTGATMAFRERFRGLLLPIPANLVHDYWSSILLAACGDFQAISDALIQYRQHAGQQIGSGPGRLTLLERIERARKNSRQCFLAEAEGLRQICERLNARAAQFPYKEAATKLLSEKIAHRSARAKLPRSRFLRVPVVLREVANRGYWRYSEGWKSVANDAFL
jgi:glycosyltransferase involved in cell wall biosynthesis